MFSSSFNKIAFKFCVIEFSVLATNSGLIKCFSIKLNLVTLSILSILKSFKPYPKLFTSLFIIFITFSKSSGLHLVVKGIPFIFLASLILELITISESFPV